jgi:hypothetical protein
MQFRCSLSMSIHRLVRRLIAPDASIPDHIVFERPLAHRRDTSIILVDLSEWATLPGWNNSVLADNHVVDLLLELLREDQNIQHD